VNRARFAWVLNLDAEFELATPGYQAQRRLLDQLRLHGAAARALLGPLDCLIDHGAPAPAPKLADAEWIGRAWCPTPNALGALRAAGVEPEPHPKTAVLRRVNHRRFAYELGLGLPNSHYCESRARLEVQLEYGAGPWLLKRPLAFAGRGQLRLYRAPDRAQSAWIVASFESDGLMLEPLVTPALELSCHGFLQRDGSCEFGVPCVQVVSERGVFRAVRRAQPGELTANELERLRESSERTANALAVAGYFGPFGIDAYRYDAPFGAGFCALGEINARYTLGFLTGFPRPPRDLRL
jgi:hypothetical protein